ncbi:hypothetical protein [Williamsia sp.]|uniref:AlbA family DNA-binding domain-containing protein n=1 Tax=Williamsia sp. TaxID=1872085 RepID=UPI002F91EA01
MPLEVAEGISLSSLRRALAAAADHGTVHGESRGIEWPDLPVDSGSLLIADATENVFDGKHSPIHPASLVLVDDELRLRIDVELTNRSIDAQSVGVAIRPMLSRAKASLAHCSVAESAGFAGGNYPWAIDVNLNLRGRTVGDALELAQSIEALLKVLDGGRLGDSAAWDLLEAGQVAALFGQPESEWLEVKSKDWDLATEPGKIEMAQDISRFANGDVSAVLVVGLGSKKVDGVDTVHCGPPSSFTSRDAHRHHQIIDQRVYPSVVGLRVAIFQKPDGGDVLAFRIPQQPAELKPFLVHGAVVGPKVEGAFISIVRRRGEHSITVSPQVLHAQIAAGRAFLHSTGAQPPIITSCETPT